MNNYFNSDNNKNNLSDLEVIIINKNNVKEDLNSMGRIVWLNYFNEYLYKMGLISEKEKQQIKLKIG